SAVRPRCRRRSEPFFATMRSRARANDTSSSTRCFENGSRARRSSARFRALALSPSLSPSPSALRYTPCCRQGVSRLRLALLSLLMLPCAAAGASAQSTNRFALGLDYIVRTSDRASTQDYAEGQLGPGLLWRFGEAKQGWGFH